MFSVPAVRFSLIEIWACMNRLFPLHPCVLARRDNPFRCEWPREKDGDGRCSICRAAMRDDVWRALIEGDRSFAEFVLTEDLLLEHGFQVGEYRGTIPGDPVYALVKSKSAYLVDPGDCVITPIADGRYALDAVLSADAGYAAECDDLTQAWQLVRPFL